MSEKTYILNVYNTMTGEFELVQVTKEVFQTYRRTKWHIEDSTERFYKHETQMSSLIGGENDRYERFREFIDYDNTPKLTRRSVTFPAGRPFSPAWPLPSADPSSHPTA